MWRAHLGQFVDFSVQLPQSGNVGPWFMTHVQQLTTGLSEAGSHSDARVDVGIIALHVVRGRILLRGGEAST